MTFRLTFLFHLYFLFTSYIAVWAKIEHVTVISIGSRYNPSDEFCSFRVPLWNLFIILVKVWSWRKFTVIYMEAATKESNRSYTDKLHCVFSNYITEATNMRKMLTISERKTYKSTIKEMVFLELQPRNIVYHIGSLCQQMVPFLCHGLSDGAFHFSFKSAVSLMERGVMLSRANKPLL